MRHCKPVYIFEGPDGSGKSTAAAVFAEKIGARLVHSGVFPKVTTGLARLYVEAMLPALLGYQAVVMDRCWMSESIYGSAFRGGANRLTWADELMLYRIAARCGGLVIGCLPPKELVTKTFLGRKGDEYLDRVEQLHAVYDGYVDSLELVRLAKLLPVVDYVYTVEPDIMNFMQSLVERDMELEWPTVHHLGVQSIGNSNSKVCLVGEKFGDHKNDDPLIQFPFVSFANQGCSRWLSETLWEADLGSDFLWVNSDIDWETFKSWLQDTGDRSGTRFIALGLEASRQLELAGLEHELVLHPQHHKRFGKGEPYALVEAIRRALAD